MKSQDIKKEFGILFKMARRRAGLSRRDLSFKIGVSQNTIKNWESGSTFIEDLGLILPIREHLNIYIPQMLDAAISKKS